jgi:hypothetical protein
MNNFAKIKFKKIGVIKRNKKAQANAGRSVSTASDAIEVQDIQPFAFKDLLE